MSLFPQSLAAEKAVSQNFWLDGPEAVSASFHK
jgi:hypothetical protein